MNQKHTSSEKKPPIHCDKCGDDYKKMELKKGKCPDCGDRDNLCGN